MFFFFFIQWPVNDQEVHNNKALPALCIAGLDAEVGLMCRFIHQKGHWYEVVVVVANNG